MRVAFTKFKAEQNFRVRVACIKFKVDPNVLRKKVCVKENFDSQDTMLYVTV